MPVTERLPATLGPYRLQDRLGEGGMGVVHLALDPEGRRVALKVLRLAGTQHDDRNARARLVREVETMRRVRSPYVAEVLDADVTGEYPYIVTRYVSGPTLDQMIRQNGPLSPQGVQRLAIGLAEALRAIHAAGIVHRDLKPGNVMLTDDRPVVIDFGIAQAPEATRLTQTGLVMGTPGYLAPEVIEGMPSSPASDVHAWGATVAFAATGRTPFGNGSFETIFFRVVSGRADLSGVPAALVPVVSAALSKDPVRRPTAAWLSEQSASPGSVAAAYAPTLDALDALDARPVTQNHNGNSQLLRPKPAPPVLPSSLSGVQRVDGLLRRAGRAGRPGRPGPTPAEEPRPPAAPAVPPNPAGWLPGLAVTVALAAIAAVLPVAGLVASLAVITLLRAADMAQHRITQRRAVRGRRPSDPLVSTVMAPLAIARSVITTVLLAPLALAAGAAAWAATIAVTHHATDPRAPALAAAAVIVCYGIGPGSSRPRRQIHKITGALVRTQLANTAAAIAIWCLAGAAVTFAASQQPDLWPAPALHLPALAHIPMLPHVPHLPHVPSLHSLVSSTANWLSRHVHA
jgi:serine/threonine protein kinase